MFYWIVLSEEAPVTNTYCIELNYQYEDDITRFQSIIIIGYCNPKWLKNRFFLDYFLTRCDPGMGLPILVQLVVQYNIINIIISYLM